MILRAAVPADIPAVLDIWNPVIRDSVATFNSIQKTPRDLTQMIADKAALGHGFLIGEAEGQILGFATYGQFRGGIGYAHTMEHTIVLGPATRRKGLGRILLLAIEVHARAYGAHSIFAGVCAENTDARAFHAAMGYAHVATLAAVGYKFERWMDLHLMQKFLT